MAKFNLQQIMGKVYPLLVAYPRTRDDDRLLIVKIWFQESKSDTKADFFREFINGELSFPDTITRARRKIQETHRGLRGEKWERRHEMQSVVCKQLLINE